MAAVAAVSAKDRVARSLASAVALQRKAFLATHTGVCIINRAVDAVWDVAENTVAISSNRVEGRRLAFRANRYVVGAPSGAGIGVDLQLALRGHQSVGLGALSANIVGLAGKAVGNGAGDTDRTVSAQEEPFGTDPTVGRTVAFIAVRYFTIDAAPTVIAN